MRRKRATTEVQEGDKQRTAREEKRLGKAEDLPDESRTGSQKREVTLRRSHAHDTNGREAGTEGSKERREREREKRGREFAGAAVATYLLHEACLALGESDLPTALVLDVGDADLPPASCAGLQIFSWPRRHRHQRTSSALLLHCDSCDDTEGSLAPHFPLKACG